VPVAGLIDEEEWKSRRPGKKHKEETAKGRCGKKSEIKGHGKKRQKSQEKKCGSLIKQKKGKGKGRTA